MSHAYVDRIARIPDPQPPPAPPSPSLDDDLTTRGRSPSEQSDGFDMDYSYARGGHDSAADAARDLEDNILGTGSKAARKRHVAGNDSDDSSEADVPIAASHSHANKKRKLAKLSGLEGVQDVDASYQNGMGVPLGVKSLVASAKGKGKGKQRETSVDSGSATPKGRRRGLKKGVDGLPPHAHELLFASGSASAPLSRDGSPLGSRAPSPALTTTSATFYELDDTIPALKKARRVDDMGMMKRVKSLEEAQKKVWTNIARRDVVKVWNTAYVMLSTTNVSLRSIATILRGTKRDKRSSSVWLLCRLYRPADPTCARPRVRRMFRLRANVSCVRCWCSGRRMRRKSEMCEGGSIRKQSTARRLRRRSVRLLARPESWSF